MNELQQVLQSPDKTTLFLTVMCAFIAFKFLVSLFDWFKDRYGIETKATRREKNQVDTIANLKSEVELIKSHQTTMMKSVDAISQAVKAMQEKSDAAERARLKDRIGQAYRYYNEKGRWNTMEKDAFEDLINSYEAAGGKNSFVHDICMPESLKWDLID